MQIKICAEYRDMLHRPRLVCQEPGLKPTAEAQVYLTNPADILIWFIAYIFQFLFLCGFGWGVTMYSALCHSPL